ncbi:MAG: hypothetical protein DYG92_05860 [Leptolyngbya sp. PLA1]|nr:hypothetical protein [Leptolyngbya sp. PLA1]
MKMLISAAVAGTVLLLAHGVCRAQPFAFEEDGLTSTVVIPGYKCETFDQGCPKDTILVDSGGSNGCTALTCAGGCTTCSGGSTSVELCVRKPGSDCTLATTGSSVPCGDKGNGTCFTATPTTGDINGCGCAPPRWYTGQPCTVRRCIP